MSSFWNLFGKQGSAPEPNAEGDEGDETDARAESTATGEGMPPSPSVNDATELDPSVLQSVKTNARLPALPKPKYGIDDAMRLMRSLPVDENVDLVVRVMKRTLESLDVRVPDIIEDASTRQEALRNGIRERETSIQQLEREIETRRAEIASLEDELAETSTVRERLQLAESLHSSSLTPRISNAPAKPPPAGGPPGRSAPPLPPNRPDTTFRPKPTPQELKKAVVAPTEATEGDPDAEVPVESSDMLEKTS
jgi:hypothetical protein